MQSLLYAIPYIFGRNFKFCLCFKIAPLKATKPNHSPSACQGSIYDMISHRFKDQLRPTGFNQDLTQDFHEYGTGMV